jgi:hypothetical protein
MNRTSDWLLSRWSVVMDGVKEINLLRVEIENGKGGSCMTSLCLRFIIVCACIGRDDLEFRAGMTKPIFGIICLFLSGYWYKIK